MEVQLKDGVIWTISNKITDGVGILEASTTPIGPTSEEVLANNTSFTTMRTKTTTTTNQKQATPLTEDPVNS